jgi:hypothetical protein
MGGTQAAKVLAHIEASSLKAKGETVDEKVEQENQEFIAEQKRIKRLEERYPGVSIVQSTHFLNKNSLIK